MKKQPLSVTGVMMALFTLVLCCLPTTHAQQTDTDTNVAEPNSLLDKMIGKWVMTGTIVGEDVTHDVTVDRILKRQYLRIHEISRELDADGELPTGVVFTTRLPTTLKPILGIGQSTTWKRLANGPGLPD